MDVSDAIEKRRAYRSIEDFEVTDELIDELSRAASLAPSCANKQPWRYVFSYGEGLEEVKDTLSDGNYWAKHSPLIAAVFSKEEDDCIVKDRRFHQFDLGMATAFMILKATELGLVCHPIAGFSPSSVRKAMNIPDEYGLLALLVFGKKTDDVGDWLSEKHRENESERPARMPLEEFAFKRRFSQQDN